MQPSMFREKRCPSLSNWLSMVPKNKSFKSALQFGNQLALVEHRHRWMLFSIGSFDFDLLTKEASKILFTTRVTRKYPNQDQSFFNVIVLLSFTIFFVYVKARIIAPVDVVFIQTAIIGKKTLAYN